MGINIPIGIVANRVRLNTRAFKQLQETLASLNIPLVAFLRDTQNYVHAAESGCAIVELKTASMRKDQQQWLALIDWLESGHTPPMAPQASRAQAGSY
jgi:chromosome partitioning protein